MLRNHSLLDFSMMPPVLNIILEHLDLRAAKALRLTCREMRRCVDKAPKRVRRCWGGATAKINMDLHKRKLTFHCLSLSPFVVEELVLFNYTSPNLLNIKVTGDFLKTKGADLKTLAMDNFFGCRYDDELVFLESLTGLENMSVLKVDFKTKFPKLKMKEYPLRFHEVLQKLHNLNLENDRLNRAELGQVNEFLCAPKFTKVLKLCGQLYGSVRYLVENLAALKQRRSLAPDVNKVNYAYVDLTALAGIVNINNIPNSHINQILRYCREHSIRILNAPSAIFADHTQLFFMDIDELVETFFGWHWSLRSASARELQIASTRNAQLPWFINAQNHVAAPPQQRPRRYPLPNLQRLKVHFDTCFKTMSHLPAMHLIRTLHLGSQCGEPVCTAHPVTHLDLSFVRSISGNNETITPASAICSSTITKHYPHIKVLKLKAWDANKLSWNELWTGLNNLEELVIDDCRSLTDGCFTGPLMYRDGPVFFKFKNTLKKMTLKLNEHTKLSYTFFRDILAHMPLEEFYLHTPKFHRLSKRIMEKIALDYLSEGVFGKSVKKFPFDTFNLKNTSWEEFNEMKLQFPNAYM